MYGVTSPVEHKRIMRLPIHVLCILSSLEDNEVPSATVHLGQVWFRPTLEPRAAAGVVYSHSCVLFSFLSSFQK